MRQICLEALGKPISIPPLGTAKLNYYERLKRQKLHSLRNAYTVLGELVNLYMQQTDRPMKPVYKK